MRVDEYKTLVSEIGEYPGTVGDSCANTCRAEFLRPQGLSLLPFKTKNGIVRHPLSPWSDVSDDQILPFFLACHDYETMQFIRDRYPIFAGNGTPHSPISFAVLYKWDILANLCLLVQLFIMVCVPWRWSDANGLAWYQRLQRSSGSSADWLNWFIVCVHLKRLRKLYFTPPLDRVAENVYSYYQSEPNNRNVLLDYEEGFKLWHFPHA